MSPNDPDASTAMKTCVIVIPYFEDPTGLLASLESLRSEAELVDLIVVDDGSVRHPLESLELPPDLSVVRMRLPKNSGIEAALNFGCQAAVAKYPYVGRLDCGDLAVASRFTKQLSILKSDATIGVVGSWVEFVDPDYGSLYTLRQPASDQAIRKAASYNPPFTHPAVVMRSSTLQKVGMYPTEYPGAEDFALFLSMLEVSRGANVAEVLTICPVSPDGLSVRRRRVQCWSRVRLLTRYFSPDLASLAGWLRALLACLVPRRVGAQLRGRVSRMARAVLAGIS